MTPQDVLSQITYSDGIVTSKSSGKSYKLEDFVSEISKKLGWTKKQIKEREEYYIWKY